MESRDNPKGHRRSQTDSFLNYSFGSMSQDFLSSGNDLGGTFDDLDGVDGGLGISATGGDDVASSLVGSKHLRSLSFTDSRDLGDVEANNDIFIINSNPPGLPELDTGLGHMSPPQGVPYRQKKSIRAKRPGTNSPSAGPSHRRIKSMSSASTDQMMQDCFRRDPNVTLNELPDLGSMSMESSDLMKFTSEDWQEAFIQIGRDSEGDISGTAPGGQALPRRSLGSMDSTLGISMLNSGSPAKDTLRHMPLPPGATAGKNSGVSRAPVLIDQGSCIKNEGDSVLREFQQRGSLSRTSPTSDVLNDEYASFMHVQAQLFAPPSVRPSSPSSNTSFIMPKPSTSSKDHKKGHGRSNNTDGANGGTASGKRGISDPEYHNGPNGSTKTEDYIDTDKKSTNRGKYRCGRCGQPKVNHQCPYEIEASTRSISTQAVRQTYVGSAHPFLTEKTIVVRKRLPPTQDTSDVDSMPSESSVDRGRPPTTSLAERSPKQGQGQGQGPGQIKTEHSAAGMVAPTKVGPNQLSPVLGTHRKNSVKQENVLTKTKSGAVKSFSSPNGSTKQQNVSPQVSRGYNQNLAKSTSSDGSLYNDMLKDIRIVHPSLQRPSADSHQLATVSTDESDSNSLFLSSLSSHSSAADDNS